MRVLFDRDYIDSNCTIGYDVSYSVDNTVATCLTSYAVGAIGFTAATAVSFQFLKQHACISGLPMSLFFGITALAYTIAGIGHQITEQRDEVLGIEILNRLSYVLLIISNAILIATGITLVTTNITLIIKFLWIFVNLAVLVHSMVTKSLVSVGVLCMITYLSMSVVYIIFYIRKRSDNGGRCITYLTKAVSLLVMIAGMMVWVLLHEKCGSIGTAYEICFQNCPLPAPDFNHNALFHVIYGVGLALFAVAQLQQPDSKFQILFFFGYNNTQNSNELDYKALHKDDGAFNNDI
mmetsp:Transcript_25821/g.29751  ORF Transcript_25821/g.29751 Transcript_25821/m.29751 type:complete len:293 (-) Transcript_25821:86-964(-)